MRNALEDVRYLARVSLKALQSCDDDKISTELTERWFGDELLKETKEGLEMMGYVQGMKGHVLMKARGMAYLVLGVFDRILHSATDNTLAIDYYCNQPDSNEGVLAYYRIWRDYDEGFKRHVSESERPMIVIDPIAWTLLPPSLNRTLQDPGRNVNLNAIAMGRAPLGVLLLHEMTHALPIGGEKESKCFSRFSSTPPH